MKRLMSVALIFSLLAAPGAALAKNEGRLPAEAKPLTSKQAAQVFAGHTVVWDAASYYFNPKGTLVGITPKKDAVSSGTWDVKDNEFCFVADWVGEDHTQKPFHFRWCNQLWNVKGVVWAKETDGEDQYRGNIHDGLTENLHKGDKIGSQVSAFRKKWGY